MLIPQKHRGRIPDYVPTNCYVTMRNRYVIESNYYVTVRECIYITYNCSCNDILTNCNQYFNRSSIDDAQNINTYITLICQ